MFLFKILILILIFIILILISKDISEKFINIDPELYHDPKIENQINNNIIEHSVKVCDKNLENKIYNILCKKKTSLCDNIKYIEGISWSIWFSDGSMPYLQDISHQIYNYVLQKLQTRIIYFKLKKYKKNIKDSQEIILDYDFVFYQRNKPYAYHVNIICMYYMKSEKFDVLYVKLLGAISQDKLHIPGSTVSSVYSQVKYDNKSTCFDDDNSFEEMTTHDERVQNILYTKLMKSEDLHDEDYWKNMEYTRNQNIVRNMFLKDKQSKNTSMKNNYKNYPYCNDFEIVR